MVGNDFFDRNNYFNVETIDRNNYFDITLLV